MNLQIEAQREEISDLRGEIQSLENNITSVTNELLALDKDQTEKQAALTASLHEAKARRSALESQIFSLAESVQEKEALCEQQKDQVYALQCQVDAWQRKYQMELTEQMASSSAKLAHMETQLSAVMAELAAAATERDQAVQERETVLAQAQLVETSIRAQLSETAEAMESSLVRCDAIARTSREKQQRIEELEAQLDSQAQAWKEEREHMTLKIKTYQVITATLVLSCVGISPPTPSPDPLMRRGE